MKNNKLMFDISIKIMCIGLKLNQIKFVDVSKLHVLKNDCFDK